MTRCRMSARRCLALLALACLLVNFASAQSSEANDGNAGGSDDNGGGQQSGGGNNGGGGAATSPTTAPTTAPQQQSTQQQQQQTTTSQPAANGGFTTVTTNTQTNAAGGAQTVTQQSTQVQAGGTFYSTQTLPATTAAAGVSNTAAVFSRTGNSVVIVIANVTTTVDESIASSVQSAASQSQASASSALQANSNANASSSSNTKNWAIPVGVVGGLALLAGLAFIGMRLFKNRFAGIDDGDEPIRWPELRGNEDGGVLMPTGAHRLHGAGVDFGSESDALSMKDGQSRPPSSMGGHPGQYFDDPRAAQYYDPYISGVDPSAHPYPPSPVLNMAERRKSAAMLSSHSPAAYYAQAGEEDEEGLAPLPVSSPQPKADVDRSGTLRSNHSIGPQQILSVTNN